MSDRAALLARIRDALRSGPAPRPGAHNDPGSEGAPELPTGRATDASSVADALSHEPPDHTRWLPAVGSDFASQRELFARNAADLKAEFIVLADDSELPGQLREFAAREGWKRLATHRGALTDAAAAGLDGLEILRTDGGYNVAELERCDVGLTECEALVAQTGSVLVTARSSGGRALSVLPPHHVVLARADQMAPDLPTAFTLLKTRYGATDYPSLISFITGPSRTGDIERILVLGAHGPKKLTIFLLP